MKYICRILIILVSIHIFFSCSSLKLSQEPQIKAVNHPVESEKLSHYLYMPARQNDKSHYPLLVILHGAGGTGSQVKPINLFDTPLHSLYADLSKGVKPDRESYEKLHPRIRESFVLIPSTRNSWKPDQLDLLIKDIMENYPADENALYISGWSMGGWGTWDYGSSYPEKVAALIPICGGNSADVSLKSKNIWIFHDIEDTAVRADTSQELILMEFLGMEDSKASGAFLESTGYPFDDDIYTLGIDVPESLGWTKGLESAVGSIRYTVTNWKSHGIWGRVYAYEALWDWLFEQKRD